MFRTNLMLQLRTPTWELLNQVKQKKALKTLEQLHNDHIIQDYARPVIMLIERAFNPPVNSPDVLLDKWPNQEFTTKAIELRRKFELLVSRAGHSVFYRMKEVDDILDDLFTQHVSTSWFQVDKATFNNGPKIICFPKKVERNLNSRTAFDPSEYQEASLEAEMDIFHVDNQHSQNLFDHNADTEEEIMEPIEIIAVSGGHEI